MNSFLIIIIISVLILALILLFISKGTNSHDGDFINEEGDHSYYDRHLIEKKEFNRRNPEIKDIRTFKRLFKRKSRK